MLVEARRQLLNESWRSLTTVNDADKMDDRVIDNELIGGETKKRCKVEQGKSRTSISVSEECSASQVRETLITGSCGVRMQQEAVFVAC